MIPIIWCALISFVSAETLSFEQTYAPTRIFDEFHSSAIFGIPRFCDTQVSFANCKRLFTQRASLTLTDLESLVTNFTTSTKSLTNLCLDWIQYVKIESDLKKYPEITYGHALKAKPVSWQTEGNIYSFLWCPMIVDEEDFRSFDQSNNDLTIKFDKSLTKFFLDDVAQTIPSEGNQITVENLKAKVTDPIAKRFGRCRTLTFAQDTPAAVLHQLDREFYVPMWGSRLRITEDYQVVNEGSPRTNGFDGSLTYRTYERILGLRRPHRTLGVSGIGSRLSYLAQLPPHTKGVEIYDHVGNITSTHVFQNDNKRQVVEIEPRFPALGGWKNDWTIRYHPFAEYYQEKNVLSLPSRPAVSDMWIEKETISIILPPFAKVEKVELFAKGNYTVEKPIRKWFDLIPCRSVVKIYVEPRAVAQSGKEHSVVLGMIKYSDERRWGLLAHMGWFVISASLLSGVLGAALGGKKFKANHHRLC